MTRILFATNAKEGGGLLSFSGTSPRTLFWIARKLCGQRRSVRAAARWEQLLLAPVRHRLRQRFSARRAATPTNRQLQ
jgi:hypothetical protein